MWKGNKWLLTAAALTLAAASGCVRNPDAPSSSPASDSVPSSSSVSASSSAPASSSVPAPASSSASAPASSGAGAEPAEFGEEDALEAALAHARLSREEVERLTITPEYDNGVLTYDVDFSYGGYEYDYDIDPATGEIIKYEKDPESTAPGDAAPSGSGSNIQEAEAKAAALTHAGLQENDIRKYKWELDLDKGRTVYEIEFESGLYDYEYKIDAFTGEILKYERDLDD